jgi:hypothetical protein
VPGVREWLDRFRPAGAPGAATAVGVPVDRRKMARAELEPVFAALADDLGRAAERRDEMIAEAARRRAEGRDAARALVESARASSTAERAAAETRLRRLATEQTRARREQGHAQAERVRDAAARRRPMLVGDILARIQAEIDELGHSAGTGSPP